MSLNPPEKIDYFRQLDQMEKKFANTSFLIFKANLENTDINLYKKNINKIADLFPESISFSIFDIDDFTYNDLASLIEAIDKDPFFKKFFRISGDSLASYLLFNATDMEINTKNNISQIIENNGLLEYFYISGPTLWHELRLKAMTLDIHILLPLAIFIIFILYIFISRNILMGLVLLLSSVLPAIWVIGLFPLLHLPLNIISIFCPLEVLVFSTSFGLHLFMHYRRNSFTNIYASRRKILPIISMAAGTTILGIATLFLSGFKTLRSLALVMIIGLSISYFFTFILLPEFIKLVSIKKTHHAKHIKKIMALKYKTKYKIIPAVIAVFIAVVGTFLIDFGIGRESVLNKFNLSYHELEKKMGAEETLFSIEVFIDTDVENGIVDMDRYKAIQNFNREIGAESWIRDILTINDFADWMHSQLGGGPKIDNEFELGEALESLSSGEFDELNYSLINPEYSAVRMQYQYDARQKKHNEVHIFFLDKIEKYFPDNKAYLKSEYYTERMLSEYIVHEEFRSVLLFLTILILTLSIIYKDFIMALINSVPVIGAILAYLGSMGLFGIHFMSINLFSIAVLMGVSVDDSICFLWSMKHSLKQEKIEEVIRTSLADTGQTIIMTTLVICSGLTSLLLSQFRYISEIGLLLILGFSSATWLTYNIIPIMVSKRYTKKRRLNNEK